ncbi:MAG: class II fructose-bisphosphate aldolase, partial [Gemmatimonadaceae bacterium]
MDSVNNIFGADISVLDGKVSVRNEAALKTDKMDKLVAAAVFGAKDEKDYARWLLWELGQEVGVQPSSIHDLYMARGRG